MRIEKSYSAPALLILVFLLTAAIEILPASYTGLDKNPYLAACVLQIFIFIIPGIIYCRLTGGNIKTRLRLSLPGARSIMFSVFASSAMIFGNAGLNFLMNRLLPAAYESRGVSVYQEGAAASGGMLAVLALSVVPAISEELLFRGVILSEYESYGTASAVILSTLTFAMVHFSTERLIAYMPSYIYSGLILVFAAYVSRSVITSVIIHIIYNIFTLFFESTVYKIVNRQGIVIFCFAVVVFTLLSLIMMTGEAQRIYAHYGNTGTPSDYRVKRKRTESPLFIKAFFSPVFLVLCLLFIICAALM